MNAVELLGVPVAVTTKPDAVALFQSWMRAGDGCSRAAFIANAHTLNLAWEDDGYRDILRRADVVLGDGIGVRLAARMKGVRLEDNLVGTDLLPLFFRSTPGARYFLLGASAGTVSRAVERLGGEFPGIRIVGHHHGYVHALDPRQLLDTINRATPDMLIVAMGNPLQERWIHDHLPRLRVPVSIGVGGLVDHWAGNLRRAPLWMRRAGLEWLHILVSQPYKWRRYVLGNPKFVYRALRSARLDGSAPLPSRT